jgi:hypothetical protein
VLLESVLVDLALLDRQVAIRDLIGRLEGSGSGPGGGTSRPAAEGPAGRPAAPRAGTGDRAQPAKPSPAAPERNRDGTAPAAAIGERGAEGRAPGRRSFELGEPQGAAEPLVPPKDTDFASLDYASQRRLWESFVTQVRQKKVTLGVCLISGTLASFEQGVVTLRFAKGCAFQREQVEDAANQKFLESATKKYFGRELRISCVGVDDGKETRRKPKDKTPPTGQASADGGGIEANPLVQKIIDDFDGEIIRHHPQ